MKKNLVVAFTVLVVILSVFFIIRFINSSGNINRSRKSLKDTGSFSFLLKEGNTFLEKGELLKAQKVFKEIMASYTFRPGIEEIQKKLEDLNMRILLSGLAVPGETVSYLVKKGDSLDKIAKEFDTTVAFIKMQNGLASDLIKPDMQLRIWTKKFSVAVDKSQNILLLKSEGEVIKTYIVSTGKDNITPVGTFKITNKLVNPVWTHDGKIIPPESPENILGTRWLGFDLPGYGIHGTTQPESIGKQVTAGCVRMLNSDVQELYDLLPIGTEVIIVD